MLDFVTSKGGLDAIPGSRLSQVPFWHSRRSPYKTNLRKAWHHFFEFRKDKENTREVFRFFDHLPWTDVSERVRWFLSTDRGKRVFQSEPFLPDLLDNYELLRTKYNRGSLAYDYCDYMEREGLSAQGLVDEFNAFRGEQGRIDDQIEWYNDRLRDTHDLLHILTGIGRDTLGEAVLGAYVFDQRPSRGHLVLGIAGSMMIKSQMKTKAPVLRAVWNAKGAGKGCKPIAEEPIRQLLALTADEARAYLNIRPAKVYQECIRIWREEELVDPNQILANETLAI